MVQNTKFDKMSEPGRIFFAFLTMKECSDHSETNLKWIFRSKLMGLKKNLEKRPILSKAASSSLYLFCDELSGHHSQINTYKQF